jgi:hypothetical protein
MYELHLAKTLSGAPFNKRSLLFLYPETMVLMVFLFEVKSSFATSLIFYALVFSYSKTVLIFFGLPMSFSANTFNAASVGSPTFENVLFFSSTSILEVLLKRHPILSVSINSFLLPLEFFFYSSSIEYLQPIGS